jgi:hypothetical protein
MKPRCYVIGSLITAFLFVAASARSQSEPKVSTKDIMKFKLPHAQRVLEGIATENYEVVADKAKKLKALKNKMRRSHP